MDCSITSLSSLGFTHPAPVTRDEKRMLCRWLRVPVVCRAISCSDTPARIRPHHLENRKNRDNLGHPLRDSLETGKHKPLVLEQTMVQRRWRLPESAQVQLLGAHTHPSAVEGETLTKMNKWIHPINKSPLKGNSSSPNPGFPLEAVGPWRHLLFQLPQKVLDIQAQCSDLAFGSLFLS